MKVEEIRALSDGELSKQLEAAHEELLKLRFGLATKQLVNYCEIPRVQKKIARLKTVIRERELGVK